MRWRYLLGIITLHFCFFQNVAQGRITQNYFAFEAGKKNTLCSQGSGFLSELLDKTTVNIGIERDNCYFFGIFTGHGISKRKWQDNFLQLFKNDNFVCVNFEDWFKKNNLHLQLDNLQLVTAVKDRFPQMIISNINQDLQLLRVLINVFHIPFVEQTKKIGSSASTCFACFKDNQLLLGSIGENRVLIIEDNTVQGLETHSVNGIGTPNFDSLNFPLQKNNLINKPYCILLINKSISKIINDEDMLAIYQAESYAVEGLAKRVAARIMRLAKSVYQKMIKKWHENAFKDANSSREGDMLEQPTLSISVIVVNDPDLNGYSKDNAEKEFSELEDRIVKDDNKIDSLIASYSRRIDSSKSDEKIKKIVKNAAHQPLTLEGRSWWDKAVAFITNEYFIGTLVASMLGSIIYRQFFKKNPL